MIRPFARFSKRAIGSLLVVMLLVQTTGCTTWKTVSLSVAAVEGTKNKVKVVLKAGGTVTSDSVRVRGDSVVTYHPDGVGTIPLAEVKVVKVHRSNPWATGALILGFAAALAALYAALGAMVRAAD